VKIALLLLVGFGALHSLPAQAEFSDHRGWLHLNGYSHHFAASDANDRLLGIGFTHYRRLYGRVLPAWEFDMFQDSGQKFSAYIGHSWTVPFEWFSAGITGAIMYHRNFAAQNKLRTLPVAFPFIETRGTRLKVRLYYVPPVRSASDQQIALQLMLPWTRR
jgi:hypothetical protein